MADWTTWDGVWNGFEAARSDLQRAWDEKEAADNALIAAQEAADAAAQALQNAQADYNAAQLANESEALLYGCDCQCPTASPQTVGVATSPRRVGVQRR